MMILFNALFFVTPFIAGSVALVAHDNLAGSEAILPSSRASAISDQDMDVPHVKATAKLGASNHGALGTHRSLAVLEIFRKIWCFLFRLFSFGLKSCAGQCPSGFSGKNCETNIDDCPVPNPCLNGACLDGINDFSCICASGFSGDNCETNIDDCPVPNPCLNGGTCTDGVNDFSCSCAPGFSGDNCECPAQPNPCQNGGICTDGINGLSCSCATGFIGDFCDECEIANLDGDIFIGSDGRFCYNVTIGASWFQDISGQSDCESVTYQDNNDFLIGDFTDATDNTAFYEDGDSAGCPQSRSRSGTVEVKVLSSLNEPQIVFSEPLTCTYLLELTLPSCPPAASP